MAEKDYIEAEEFDWDDEIENDSKFTLLEPGDYDFKVTNFERGRSKKGNKKAILTLEVTNGKVKATITDDISLLKTAEWKICEFFRSVGLRKSGEKFRMPWNKVVGLTGRCSIIQYEYPRKDGTYGKANDVDTYLDPVGDSGVDW